MKEDFGRGVLWILLSKPRSLDKERFIAILVYAEFIIENAAIVGMYMVERLMMPFDDSKVLFPKTMFNMKRNSRGKIKVKNAETGLRLKALFS
tara:strand:+ start:253 stop:531 length:279 start_codon:yes stop_codon:yes gene_type:complete